MEEIAYVIQRDDGKYLESLNNHFTSYLVNALLCNDKHLADYFIVSFKLKNCRPVKVKIEVCE